MSLRKSLALVAAAAVVGMLTFVGTAAAAGAPRSPSDPASVEVGGMFTSPGTECLTECGRRTHSREGQVAAVDDGGKGW